MQEKENIVLDYLGGSLQGKKTKKNIVLDYLGGYNRSLIEEMGRLLDMTQTEATRLLRKSQKWVHCQNCEIVKNFIFMNLLKKKVEWDRVPSLGETIYIKKTQGTFDSLLHQGGKDSLFT